MQKSMVYVRVLNEQIPETQKKGLAFRDDRNYVVIHVDPDKNRMLIPDDRNRLIWVPMSVLRFVKVS